jgi:hypothetical protein
MEPEKMRLPHHVCASAATKKDSRTLLSPTDPRFGVILDTEHALPYGYWETADGELVLFDRRYRPLFVRLRGGRVTRCLPYWVAHIHTVYLWPPKRSEDDFTRLVELLMVWTRAAAFSSRGMTYTRRELLPTWARKLGAGDRSQEHAQTITA